MVVGWEGNILGAEVGLGADLTLTEPWVELELEAQALSDALISNRFRVVGERGAANLIDTASVHARPRFNRMEHSLVHPIRPNELVSHPKLFRYLPHIHILIRHQPLHHLFHLFHLSSRLPFLHQNPNAPRYRFPKLCVRVFDRARKENDEGGCVWARFEDDKQGRFRSFSNEVVRSSDQIKERRDVEPLEEGSESFGESRGKRSQKVQRMF